MAELGIGSAARLRAYERSRDLRLVENFQLAKDYIKLQDAISKTIPLSMGS